MTRLGFLAFVAVVFALAPRAYAESSPVGVWVTEEGKSRIEIYRCGDELCGRIIWLRKPTNPDGSAKVDKNNPDADKRQRKILGLQIMRGFTPADSAGTKWEDGSIYNPEDGDTYRCKMRVREDGSLRVRGYVGVPLLGKTQIWTRHRSAAGN